MKDIIEHAVKEGFDLINFSYEIGLGGETEKIAEYLFDHDIDNILIFRHDFLKGFFGEEYVCDYCGEKIHTSDCPLRGHPEGHYLEFLVPVWQYHAQQLVLAEDRKEYLRGFIDGNTD